jgi:hypothetical protein
VNFEEGFRLAVGRPPTAAETKKCQLYQTLLQKVDPPLDAATIQYMVSLGSSHWPPETRDLVAAAVGAFVTAVSVAIVSEAALHPPAMAFVFMGAAILTIVAAFLGWAHHQ